MLLDKKISLRQALSAAVDFLSLNGIEDARTDAMLLAEKVTGYSKNQFFMNSEREMTDKEAEEFSAFVKKRSERIPLQHITGEAWFYGRKFFVDKNVLIPRMDTEILIEESLKYIGSDSGVLDLCTGSGCIAVTLSLEAGIRVEASDISEAALRIAEKNARDNNADCVFIKSDMFDHINKKYDIIVSNPPYIKPDVIKTLEPEVRKADPYIALYGGEDGLAFYRQISHKAVNYLVKEGRLCLEIGYDQAEEVSEMLKKEGFCDIEVVNDLNNLPRVVSAKLK